MSLTPTASATDSSLANSQYAQKNAAADLDMDPTKMRCEDTKTLFVHGF